MADQSWRTQLGSVHEKVGECLKAYETHITGSMGKKRDTFNPDMTIKSARPSGFKAPKHKRGIKAGRDHQKYNLKEFVSAIKTGKDLIIVFAKTNFLSVKTDVEKSFENYERQLTLTHGYSDTRKKKYLAMMKARTALYDKIMTITSSSKKANLDKIFVLEDAYLDETAGLWDAIVGSKKETRLEPTHKKIPKYVVDHRNDLLALYTKITKLVDDDADSPYDKKRDRKLKTTK